jgi:hypothetical protein
MSKYIEEFGLKKVRNASADPDKQAEVTISRGFVALNKVAADIIEVAKHPHVEIFSGEQGGASIFALEFHADETRDSVEAKVAKKGTARISIKVPLKKYSHSLTTTYGVSLIDIEPDTLVFSIGTVKKPEPQDEKPVKRGTPAPFGKMTAARESFDDEGKPIGTTGVGGGMGVPFADSDF